MRHTPGPWGINKYASMVVETNSGRTIASCGGYSSTSENTEPENQANAKLIAATPKLLSALNDLLAYVEDGYGDHESDEGMNARKILAEIEGD